jgi:tetraacyldisaccharide 4'-kinase
MWSRARKPVARVEAHVVSFGNLTAGGTGKTPAVIERASREIDAGRKVGVLTRGYRAAAKVEVISAEITPGEYYEKLGDEAALLLSRVPDIIVFKGRDRVAMAQRAVRDHGCEVLLLDDAFQYLRLHRDENVLLIDAANPFGNGRLIPRGILREPLSAMKRATEVVLTRCDQANDLDGLVETVRALHPAAPLRKTVHAPRELRRFSDGETLPIAMLKGQSVTALCGIGHPESFRATLESLGARVDRFVRAPNHAEIPASAIPDEGLAIVTEKDTVRLKELGDNVLCLCVELADFRE